jgi:TolB-like protein
LRSKTRDATSDQARLKPDDLAVRSGSWSIVLPVSGQQTIRFSGFRLDPGRGLARDDGTEVQLRPKSLELLVFLVSQAGRVVSKDELVEVVWNGLAVTEDSLTQCVHDVRRALSDTEQNLIRTVPRRGYLFAGQVSSEATLSPRDGAGPPLTTSDGPSLAVLPFLNLSGDPGQDYFADGMVEEITTALTRMKWLFVIARNSSFSYKGRNVDIGTISRELGVRYVLEGSVRKSSDRMRVTAQLVDASSGLQLWAEKFDGLLEDIFDLQDQITAKVVGAIAPRLELAEINRVSRKPTESLQAYDYYLRGLAAVYRVSREGNNEALASLYRAIDLDPGFATAYGVAARVYVQRASGTWIEDFEREYAEAERLARRAVELGQDDSVALASAAFALCELSGDPQSATLCVEKALALTPSLASAWLYSAWIRCAVADWKTALDHIGQVWRLSPNDPQAFSIHCCEGMAHFCAGNYQRALACAEAARQVKADYMLGHCLALASAAEAGVTEAAAAALQRARRMDPGVSIARVSRIQNFLDRDVREAWFHGLRRGGLPEETR